MKGKPSNWPGGKDGVDVVLTVMGGPAPREQYHHWKVVLDWFRKPAQHDCVSQPASTPLCLLLPSTMDVQAESRLLLLVRVFSHSNSDAVNTR